jgi:ABC-type sugar transport system permease subunit
MILPTMLLYFVFTLYPLASSIGLSLHKWDGIGPKVFVGLDNYIQAFKDPMMWLSLKNNLQYCLGLIAFGVVPGLVLASLLAGDIKARLAFQTVFFFPRLLSMVIVSVIWGWIYNPMWGIVNRILRFVGFTNVSIGWLGHVDFAIWAVAVAGGWTYFGFCMVIFIAALRSTDPSLYDAAEIDGANGAQRFFFVTLPQISSVMTMVLIITMIDAFQIFDIIYLMTGGGPGRKTEIMSTYLYTESFRHDKFGYGATLATLLTATVLVISVIFQRYRERNEQ